MDPTSPLLWDTPDIPVLDASNPFGLDLYSSETNKITKADCRMRCLPLQSGLHGIIASCTPDGTYSLHPHSGNCDLPYAEVEDIHCDSLLWMYVPLLATENIIQAWIRELDTKLNLRHEVLIVCINNSYFSMLINELVTHR